MDDIPALLDEVQVLLDQIRAKAVAMQRSAKEAKDERPRPG